MNNTDWEDLTQLIKNLTAYKNEFFVSIDKIVEHTPPAGAYLPLQHHLFEPLTITQIAEQAKRSISVHIAQLEKAYEAILQDVVDGRYEYTNRLIQLSIHQSIQHLGTMGSNQLIKLQTALKLIRLKTKVQQN